MRWRKVWVVATTEFNNAVRTKAFLVSLLLLPLIMFGSAFLQVFLAKRVDTTPRAFAVVDHSGQLYDVIATAADAHNRAAVGPDGKPNQPQFLPQRIDPSDAPARQAVGGRVKAGELFAVIEIPVEVNDPSTSGEPAAIRYYSDNPNDDTLANWLGAVVNNTVRGQRLKAAGIDPAEAARLSAPVGMENMSLAATGTADSATDDSAGNVPGLGQARAVDPVRTVAIPAVLMFVVFMVVMTTTPQLLNSVIEEKMSKISEVLLGSITPFELMMGKLFGNVAIALLLAGLYVGAGYGVASYLGYASAVPPHLLAATALFIVMAVFLFGSMYLAVGSACSELKDAQSLMMPVMLLSMLPLFCWLAVIKAPTSPLSVGLSLFPPATPYLMLLRMAAQPPAPLWQVGLSLVLTTLAVLFCVWAAAKIFRTGLLMQGKAPTFVELAKWVVAK